ncbi:MAG: M48 family metallopeptidase [Pseudomonadota bacterium]
MIIRALALCAWLCSSVCFGERLAEADEAALRMERVGAIIEAPELSCYLESLTLRLFPELSGSLTIKVVAHPSANAFSLGDDRIFVHSGLFLRVHREAELAAILAHEGAHLWHRHESENTNEARRNEAEADRTAITRLRSAGIPVRYGADLFQRLMQERETFGFRRRAAAVTHPDLDNRSRRWLEADERPQSQWKDPSDWSQLLLSVREVTLRQLLDRQEHERLVFLLDQEGLGYAGPDRDLALAHALQARNAPGDRTRAAGIYARLIDTEQGVPEAFSSQARLFLRSGRLHEANMAFRRYLERSTDPQGRRWAEHYVAWLESQASP